MMFLSILTELYTSRLTFVTPKLAGSVNDITKSLPVRPGEFVFTICILIQMNTGTEVFPFIFEYLQKQLKVFALVLENLPKVCSIY